MPVRGSACEFVIFFGDIVVNLEQNFKGKIDEPFERRTSWNNKLSQFQVRYLAKLIDSELYAKKVF